jgi:hypothetical protein
MNGDFRRRADAVRGIPLEAVLSCRGAQRDAHDKAKWATERGSVSITGSKFFIWRQGTGGGGAIDLVRSLADIGGGAAVAWLERHFVGPLASLPKSASPTIAQLGPTITGPGGGLQLPVPNQHRLGRVREYLTQRRHLSASLIDSLTASGRLYADQRANAVFLLVRGKPNRAVGAELRGTGPRVWRGMARGTRKDAGCFWIGVEGSQEIVLCESAIDAISCFQSEPARICISTSGVRCNPRWLAGLLACGYQIHCGFDTDDAGDAAARRMIHLYPNIGRLRPPAHDWNDALQQRT